jgi:hypothetical protein
VIVINNSDTSEEEDVEEDNSYNHVDAIAVDEYDVDDTTDTRDSGTS